jgi:hypothetical protein
MRRWLGKKRADDLSATRPYVVASASVTFAYLCFSLSMLWLTFDQARNIVRSYGVSGLLSAELSLVVMILLAVLVLQRFPRSIAWSNRRWWAPIHIGIACALIDAYTFLFPALAGTFFYEQF